MGRVNISRYAQTTYSSSNGIKVGTKKVLAHYRCICQCTRAISFLLTFAINSEHHASYVPIPLSKPSR